MNLLETTPTTLGKPLSTGISTLVLPDLHEHNIAKVKQSIDSFISSARKYGTASVIIDGSNSTVTLPEITFKLILDYIAIGLKSAHVQRAARVQFSNTLHEAQAKDSFSTIERTLRPSFQSEEFETVIEANAWLSVFS
ncbi:hypothetical protein FVR03_19060 [Pontibacter qinzhouensis]|uniref:STAS/SEC14 domain-containing protein n=1 Tax=Pontibacter qinzhouensis TaxID=2603253 RepID=A0A5C8J6X0_9BACT|nr:hypothetical protein [Pontibacter qinzhouensis]TXK33302.1 hypothetical protein FVR03_19060 [Pontibacter qinzhouensis]